MQEFIAMGGYAFYVWGSFGLSLIGLIYLFLSAKDSEKKNLAKVKAWQLRESGQSSKQNVKTSFFSSIIKSPYFPLAIIILALLRFLSRL